VGEFNNCIKLKIKAPPLDGKANKELIGFLSALFQVPKSSVQLLQGGTSRYKKLEICNPQALPDWIAANAQSHIASGATHD
jgi:uncharacterized protein